MRKQRGFRAWFWSIAGAERVLKAAVALTLGLLVVGQVVMAAGVDLHGLFLKRLAAAEGAWMAQAPEARLATGSRELTPWVTLELVGYSSLAGAKVLVNGQEVTSFTGATVRLRLNPGDFIAVDTAAYPQAVTVRVAEVSPGLAEPVPGYQVTLRGERQLVGRAVLLPGRP